MKRLFSFLLILSVLTSMLVFPVSAEPKLAHNTPEEIAMMQRAVAETAYAYFRKGDRVQYDWKAMTLQNRFNIGISRLSSGDAPEMASADYILFTHCAEYAYDVYMNTFGRAPADVPAREALAVAYDSYKSASEPDVVLKYGGDGGLTDKNEFVRLARELMQPGDLLSTHQANDSNGHTMLYLGDILEDGGDVVLHSSGNPSGTMGDSRTVTVKKTTSSIFLGNGSFGVMNEKIKEATILRPINIIDFDELLPAAKTRLKYSGLGLDRMADVYHYNSVEQGQEVEITLSVNNGSAEDYKDVVITDPAPVGAEIIADSVTEGGKIVNGGVQWKLDIPANTRMKFVYRVRVTAPIGDNVTLEAGKLDELPTRTLSWQVGGKAIDQRRLDPVREDESLAGITGNTETMELAFANTFYRNVLGLELGLPDTMNELINGILKQEPAPGAGGTNGYMLQPKAMDELTDEFKRIWGMIPADHITGQVVDLGVRAETMRPMNRVMTYFPDAYQPGDIFVVVGGNRALTVTDPANVDVYIYLGGGRVFAQYRDSVRIRKFADTVEQTLDANIVLCLRPTLNAEDLMAASTLPPLEPEISETPAEPVTPDAPAASAEPAIPETLAKPTAPAEEKGTPVGLIIGIAAAVVMIAAVVVAVLKKRK